MGVSSWVLVRMKMMGFVDNGVLLRRDVVETRLIDGDSVEWDCGLGN